MKVKAIKFNLKVLRIKRIFDRGTVKKRLKHQIMQNNIK